MLSQNQQLIRLDFEQEASADLAASVREAVGEIEIAGAEQTGPGGGVLDHINPNPADRHAVGGVEARIALQREGQHRHQLCRGQTSAAGAAGL